MAVDLTELVPRLEAALTVPGETTVLFTFDSTDMSARQTVAKGSNEVYFSRIIFVHNGRWLGTERAGRRIYEGSYRGWNGHVRITQTAAFVNKEEAQKWADRLGSPHQEGAQASQAR